MKKPAMKASLKKKILEGRGITTEELGDWLSWSISQYTEEQKAQLRAELWKGVLRDMKCSSVIQ